MFKKKHPPISGGCVNLGTYFSLSFTATNHYTDIVCIKTQGKYN